MDQKTMPSARLAPLTKDDLPELKAELDAAEKRMGFIPNSVLIMGRRPKMVKGFQALSASVWDPEGKVPTAFKRLLAHVASHSAGCQYCLAHTGEGAIKLGVEQRKLDAVWDYQHSSLYTPAERSALDVAVAAGCVPNAVTDEMFLELRKHWTEEQIVEIVGLIALFGFLNRWNDTMATPLEDEPAHFGETHLAKHGWTIGKHAR
ncbi:MAG: carboxymuconolactone decarboxylase family protein [Xanthobacteraceae bacterium]